VVHPFSTSTLRPRAPRHYWRRSPNRGAGRAAGRPLRSLPQGAAPDAAVGVGCWHRHDSDHPCCASRLKTLSPTPAPQSKPVETTVSATGPLPAARLARDTESPHEVLWDLYVEPASPSLPSMRGRFTTHCSTSRPHTIAQVNGASEDRVVMQSEVARSAVVLAMPDSPQRAQEGKPRPRPGHRWSRSSGERLRPLRRDGDSQPGEEVADVHAGRLLSAEERLVAPRVLGRLPSVAGRDAARGRSRVPIDPCCSPLPAPAASHYY
jgi:hypothetical protein